MDALLPVLWWLERGWAAFVARVAAIGSGSMRPRRATGAEAPDARRTLPLAPFDGSAWRSPAMASDEPAAGMAATGHPTADVVAKPSAVQARPATTRTPAWLVETHPEPPGAAALAAHLDARRAQAAGLRALLFARQRRYAEAEDAFAQAATLDPAFDLTGLDGFWELGRGAHEAAVRAYETAGRSRDAMVLRATLDGRYRPRLVRTA